MKVKKWLVAAAILLVTVAVVVSALLPGMQNKDGMTFTAGDSNRVSEIMEQGPNTIEAWIKFPKGFDTTTAGGVVFGNFDETYIDNRLNLEIVENGQVKFYRIATDGSQVHIFDKANVYTGKWTHLAVVNDTEADTVSCYVNGELVQSLDGAIHQTPYADPFIVGGDHRTNNTAYFKGLIHSVVLYEDARTAAEVQKDQKQVDADGLVAAWDLTQPAKEGIIAGLPGSKYDFHKSWYTDKSPVKDYDYSMVVLGDTQTLNFNYPEEFPDIYDWILENKEEKKIAYVLGLGDVTDRTSQREWDDAQKQFARLDGVVGYSLVRGNHDSGNMLNIAFNKEPYISSYDGQYDYRIENTWRKFEVCGVKYLIFTLDIGPNDDVLAWAEEIIKDHPDYNVIITTHLYLHSTGERLPAALSQKYGSVNGPDDMWNKLFKKYENIVMVISGHISSDYVVTTRDTGDNGNEVIQMLVDPQSVDGKYGATGLVTVLHFSEGGSKVTLETYSTVRDAYFLNGNQYEFDMPVVKAD